MGMSNGIVWKSVGRKTKRLSGQLWIFRGVTYGGEGAGWFDEYLAGLSKKAENRNKVWCLVRKNRNLKRTVSVGSHAQYADAPDSTKTEGRLRQQYSIDQPMLILIRQNGSEEDEWRGAPFY